MGEMDEVVAKLAGMKERGSFKSYIDYIRFPFFRNLEKDTRIDFDFPFTAFVGQNGCGKSSTLQALYGAPAGKSVGDYWFSTAVDPIAESAEGLRNCLIYGYKKEGVPVDPEVLKTRIFDPKNPDLWESSEPIQKYGMKMPERRGRTPPLKKSVLYLDFRQIVSAFDKALHNSQEDSGRKTQDFLRARSGKLQNAFSQGRVYRRPPNEKLITLSPEALANVSNILGRSYTRADIVNHRFFGHWGYSVKYDTAISSYSEAFAGSGEIAVVILVSRILAAETESLVLLDEPETSLHPGAQKRLKKFLFEQTVRKRHQVIISSHSPALVEGLPANAIKAFRQLSTGKFGVISNVLPNEAFFFLGQTLTDKKRIIVEDALARSLVERALASMPEQTRSLFEVQYFPGGCAVMKQDAALYCRASPSPDYLLFDGDTNRGEVVSDPDDLLTTNENNNATQAVDFLKEQIKRITGDDIKFRSDGGSQGADMEQQRDLRKAYLRYYATNVYYLPFNTPEQEIWNDEVASKALELFAPTGKDETMLKIAGTTIFKQKFAFITEALMGGSSGSAITLMHQMFLGPWEKENTSKFSQLVQIIERMR